MPQHVRVEPSRAILWDFEGTLARRVPGAWTRCSVEVLDLHEPGHNVTQEMIRPFMQSGFPWHTPDVAHPELATRDAWWSSVNSAIARAYGSVGIPEVRARELAACFRERFFDPGCWETFPDTESALVRSRRMGFRNVVLSNHAPELDELVTGLGLDPLLDAVVNSAVTGYEKPHPEAFRLAQRAAGDVAEVWMVGDRYDADIVGAEAVGVPAVLVRGSDQRAARAAPTLLAALDLIGGAASAR